MGGTRKIWAAAAAQEEVEDEVAAAAEDHEVFRDGSKIFFNADVDKESVSKLIKLIKKAEKELLHLQIEYGGTDFRITLYVHSDGGCVFSGLSAMHHIQSSRVPIDTVADGFVASAATFLLLAGKRRYITPHASVLIHQLRSENFGKFDDIVDDTKNCTQLMKTFREIYKEKTKIPLKKLDMLLRRELYLSAAECVKFGVAESA